jgi:glycosyltransferase involved in cell wall biosynthesis
MTFPPELGALIPRRVLLPWHDVVVATSDWFRDDLARTFRAPPGRIVSIPPGIDVSRFHPGAADRAQDRAKLGIPSDAEVILVAGTLGAIKRPELAIDVLERLASRRPRAMLMFAGAERNDPRYAQRLVERGAAVGLSDRIRLLGHREDMPAIYAACDLLLFCGIADNFGMVITEAMAMERPVVAVAIHGPGEIVRHEETGLLVPPPGDPDALANAVERGLDPQLAAVMGRNGRQRVVERYTIGRSAHDLDSVFDRLLEP